MNLAQLTADYETAHRAWMATPFPGHRRNRKVGKALKRAYDALKAAQVKVIVI